MSLADTASNLPRRPGTADLYVVIYHMLMESPTGTIEVPCERYAGHVGMMQFRFRQDGPGDTKLVIELAKPEKES